METVETKFKYCDSKMIPFIKVVFERLPQKVRDDLLSSDTFQILADESICHKCSLNFRFDRPVETLITLNTKMLMEPHPRIILTIAAAIARYVSGVAESDPDLTLVEGTLNEWGFHPELETVRQEETLAKSGGFRTGYAWARHQSKQYLDQHFGLYYEEWSRLGTGMRSTEMKAVLDQGTSSAVILDEITELRESDLEEKAGLASHRDKSPSREAFVAGILTAMKELTWLEGQTPQVCERGIG